MYLIALLRRLERTIIINEEPCKYFTILMKPWSHATTTRLFKEICVGMARLNNQKNLNYVQKWKICYIIT